MSADAVDAAAVGAAPTVSVVLIFHDDHRFLPEAIAGVFAQTYRDWELVLADDGATDGSTDLARACAREHPGRVRHVEHPAHANRGPAAARNLGVRAARGRYLAVHDADDVWEPDKLAEQVAILDRHPQVGLVVGASRYWWSWAGAAAEREDRIMPIGVEPDRIHRPPELAVRLSPLGRGVAPCPSSWLLRRELVEQIGGWEEHVHPVLEDQGFLGKAYLVADVWVSSRVWDRYRRHPGQLVAVTTGEHYHAALRDWLTWYEAHLRARGVTDPRLRRALRRAWLPYRRPWLAALRHAAGRRRARLRVLLRDRGGR
ncbi:glycosyltransferase family 2 protein [Egicoccus halophilus]|uniref:Glycosyltransferase 2-like domain-containing protein n=1 Tax=Egicoccus halophilus TaxID=1670830 RepID=A0A8J3A782_9ACTN|nr:glycosyltransferase family A protein [Egicoccus halophilus]GGI05426.1 hypothetical protein GCM10011354_14040 [Egicoccus halophilus]